MTATVLFPKSLSSTTNRAVRIAVIIAAVVVLAVGSFALGRSTADSETQSEPLITQLTGDRAVPHDCGHTPYGDPC